MDTIATERKFSLKCRHCGATGAPVRVEAQSETDLVLSIRCGACAHQWTAVGSLPAFMLWLKPDRRRNAGTGR